MKNLKLLFLGLIAMVVITGCDPNDDDGFFICKDGEGAVVTRTVSLSTITGINLEIKANIFLSHGSSQQVTLEGQSNVLDELEFTISNGVAKIDFDGCIDKYTTLNIYIRTPEIKQLTIQGEGEIKSESTLVIEDIDLTINGTGNIELDLGAADDIDGTIKGSGKLRLEGSADDLDVSISGSGDLKAFNLSAKKADLKITGSGDAEVNVEETLKVNISGSGDVLYKGTPTVTQTISGTGEVLDAN
ncbi:MAG: head GIN domain-containing protein [Saprospiraceae bacterium]